MKERREYKLTTKKQTIIIPKDADLLGIIRAKKEYECGNPILLIALVDVGVATEFRQFYTVYEGFTIPYERYNFIGSVVVEDGIIKVYEIYEE